jgi:hypothetical protein
MAQIKFSSYQEANKYFDDVVEQFFKSEHNISDTVDFFLKLVSFFTTAGQIYLARASIGAAITYFNVCK